jgi:hypothetical protein
LSPAPGDAGLGEHQETGTALDTLLQDALRYRSTGRRPARPWSQASVEPAAILLSVSV